MQNDYKSYKQRKFKKRILISVMVLFILVNLFIVYTPFQKIYLVKHAYPEAQKWEFMAMVVRKYGYFVSKYSPFDERDWLIKQFISLDHYLLDKAAKYIPDDDLEKHLKVWYLFESYQGWNHDSGHLYMEGVYTLEETREIVDSFWEQFEYLMSLQTRSVFYEVEKFKVWVTLSFIYTYSVSAYWKIELDKYDYKKYINDTKNLEKLMKIYDYNEYIFNYYKEKFPKVYRAYTNKGFNIRTKHLMTSHLIPYLIKNSEKYIKGDFCDINTNPYLKGYIESRNELLTMRDEPNANSESLEKIIGEYREKLITKTCKNITLIRGERYE